MQLTGMQAQICVCMLPCLGPWFCYFFVAPLFFFSFLSSSLFLRFHFPPTPPAHTFVYVVLSCFPMPIFVFLLLLVSFFFVGFSSFPCPRLGCVWYVHACWWFRRSPPPALFFMPKILWQKSALACSGLNFTGGNQVFLHGQSFEGEAGLRGSTDGFF